MAVVDSWITRVAPLPTSNLHLLTSPYALALDVGIGVHAVTWRKRFAKSIFSDGATLVSAVKDLVKQTAVVRIQDTSHANVETALAPLKASFEQLTFNLAVQLDTGTVHTWACFVADSSIPFDWLFVKSRVATYTFSFETDPIPVTGVI